MERRARVIWKTSEQELKTINPDVTFAAVIDYDSAWFETANTVAEAVEILRDLIESDGHHVFMGVDKTWRFNSCRDGAAPHLIVKWCDTITGKAQTKTINARGVTYYDIAVRHTAILAELKQQNPEKYKYW